MVYTVIVPIVLALLVGWVRGGKFSRLADVKFRGLGFVFLAFAVQLSLHAFVRLDIELPRLLGSSMFSLTYIAVLITVLLNHRFPGMILAAIGVALNATVIIANGGRMPVLRDALIKPDQMAFVHWLESGASPSHVIMTDETLLWWLGDIMHLPKHWRYHSVFSVGDILLTIGLFVFVQQMMVLEAERDPLKL